MGAGWEARRRRDIGPDTHDAVTISFLVAADLDRIEIDTSRFVFNASREVRVTGHPRTARPRTALLGAAVRGDRPAAHAIVPDARQVFAVAARDITAIRVQAYPDGGIARVRALGRPTAAGLAALQELWETAR